MSPKPLIAHVLYALTTGGMERFMVTLINSTGEHYRHAIVSLTEPGPMLREISDTSVPCVALHKRPGKDLGCYIRFWRALRSLKPDVVHSYNIGTLDLAPIARLAGTRRIVHAERGRDVADPKGENERYRRLRRWMAPFVARYLPVSRDLESWLLDAVRVDPSKVTYIPNGIDVRKFANHRGSVDMRPLTGDFAPPGSLLAMNVGRLNAVKDHAGLIEAFDRLCKGDTQAAANLRLAIVGEGAERAALERQLLRLGLTDRVRLFGNRDDVPALLAEADMFVLASVAEGMPGVVLEAMASCLPVVATRVGGAAELVLDGVTGTLVAPSDPESLAAAMHAYARDPALRQAHGQAGRARVESHFSLTSMVSAYVALYDGLLTGRAIRPQTSPVANIAGSGEH